MYISTRDDVANFSVNFIMAMKEKNVTTVVAVDA